MRGAVVALHLVGAFALAGWVILAWGSRGVHSQLPLFLAVNSFAWLAFTAAWRICSSARRVRVVPSLIVWAVAFRVAGWFALPVMEDDHWRFLWDGRQFALTGNPYATAPADHFRDETVPERFREILDQVNYPHVPTIYGPICEVSFLFSYWVAPGHLWPWKSVVVLADLLAVCFIIRLARAGPPAGELEPDPSSRRRTAAALVAGWCPLAVFETSFNAHPDILGVALLLAAMGFQRHGLPIRSAVCAGLSVAAKVFALLLVPFLLGRNPKAWIAFVCTLTAAYVSFWMRGSAADLTGLRAFAVDWEFNSSIFALVQSTTGRSQAKLLCGIVFAVIWVCVAHVRLVRPRGREQDAVLLPGVVVFGAFFLLSPTVNPWYLLWVLPFVALHPSCTGLTAMAAVSLSYVTGLNLGDPSLHPFEHPPWVRPVEYGAIAIAMAIDWRRSLVSRRRHTLIPH